MEKAPALTVPQSLCKDVTLFRSYNVNCDWRIVTETFHLLLLSIILRIGQIKRQNILELNISGMPSNYARHIDVYDLMSKIRISSDKKKTQVYIWNYKRANGLQRHQNK